LFKEHVVQLNALTDFDWRQVEVFRQFDKALYFCEIKVLTNR
jgi:hypothetical protein